MDRVLFVFPTEWDRRQLAACRSRWEDRYEPILGDLADEDWTWDLDVGAYVDRAIERHRGRIDGVTSSSDYPGAAVAAAIATELGLPGTHPRHVLRCSHKFHSRILQRAAAPEAVPPFALLDPSGPPAALEEIAFPCFVKPVRGAFSVQTRRADSIEDLRAFLTGPGVREFRETYVEVFARLVERYGELKSGARSFLAEGLLRGDLVTLEGWSFGGEVEVLGVVDSVHFPGTRSFARFDFPSRLDPAVQARMADVVRRVVRTIGLDGTLFNVELMYDRDADRISIVEVNPRMCGQFADLYEKVDGTNGYLVALSLAAGRRPEVRRGDGPCRLASSHPLRVFEPVRVLASPAEPDLRAAEALHPGTLVWSECRTGEELADFESIEDGESRRYAVVNLGASGPAERDARFADVVRRLGFRFGPLG